MDPLDSIRGISDGTDSNWNVREQSTGGASDMEETARRFEEVFIRQFVQEMTKNIFASSLASDDAPGWMGQQADMQAEVLTDVIARQMAAKGTFKIADILLKQWQAAEAGIQSSVDAGQEKPSLDREPIPEHHGSETATAGDSV